MAEITGAPPPALAVRPEVLPGLGSYLEAFELLCGSRGLGLGGPLPIPLSEIESYCRLTGWHDPDEVAELVAIIGALDAVYLDAMACRRAGEEAVLAGGKSGEQVRSGRSLKPARFPLVRM